MTSQRDPRRNAQSQMMLDSWLKAYARKALPGDMYASATPGMAGHWLAMLGRLSDIGRGDFAALTEKVARQVTDLGVAFRLTGDQDERAWPLSPIPMLIGADEWSGIERGLAQRADLLEQVIRDLYGPQSLITDGKLPATVVAGSPHFWRNMIGVTPPGGHYLHFYAADLGRGPNGDWRVLSDRVRTPIGVGYALENRLALSRATGDLLGWMNTRRLAPFFSDLRRGLASNCQRAEPRIGLLTPGRYNQSYAEQAHLARYLGFLLVEGDDLVVSEGQLFVRTIEGLKRIDALWRWMDTRFLDPLAFDGRSTIGVADLYEACARGQLVVSNWPGAGVIESRAFAAFLPALSQALLGADLILPNIATWWCGQPSERKIVEDDLETMVIGSAFEQELPFLGGARSCPGSSLTAAQRAEFLAAMAVRPMDFVGQEVVKLSTTPGLAGGDLTPHPFAVRVFVARDAEGAWKVMPGAFARLAAHGDIRAALMGDGDMSADVCVIDAAPVVPETLLGSLVNPPIRRIAGMLPSKAADNLFWLGRYLERAETTARVVRSILGGSIEVDSGPALTSHTILRLIDLLIAWGAVPREQRDWPLSTLCATALGEREQIGSVRTLMNNAGGIGKGLRERLAVDFWRLIRRPFPHVESPVTETLLEAASVVIDRISALTGLASENMGRTDGWRFHDMGRRLERAINTCRVARHFAHDDASSDDLTILLELCDCQITYRTRYMAGPSLLPVRDMVVLEAQNPRSLTYQIARIDEHMRALPSLRVDGMPEAQVQQAGTLVATLAPMTGDTLPIHALATMETRLLALSDAIGQRYFLQSRKADKPLGTNLLA